MYTEQIFCLNKNNVSGFLNSVLEFDIIPGTMSLQNLNAFIFQIKEWKNELSVLTNMRWDILVSNFFPPFFGQWKN